MDGIRVNRCACLTFTTRADGICSVCTYGFPQSSGIPSTARAIMDLVPERKVQPLTDKQQAQGEGISRAVEAMNRRSDIRTSFCLGANEWRP